MPGKENDFELFEQEVLEQIDEQEAEAVEEARQRYQQARQLMLATFKDVNHPFIKWITDRFSNQSVVTPQKGFPDGWDAMTTEQRVFFAAGLKWLVDSIVTPLTQPLPPLPVDETKEQT